MTVQLLGALSLFAFVQSITPGPNTVMLLASGANHGFRRTVPHMAGILLGLATMVLLTGVGLARLFVLFPVLPMVLTAVSVAYLIYLAARIATAAAPGGETAGAPLTPLQAAMFQWVNPKAWAMTVSAITLYAPDNTMGSALLVAAVVCAVGVPAMMVWALAGTQVKRFIGGRRLVYFNWTMAALLLLSLIPALVWG